MYFYLYKINDKVNIILYSNNESDFPENIENLGLIKGDSIERFDVEPYIDYPIFDASQFMESIQPFNAKRSRDKKLSEAGVETTRQLANNYLLVKYKASPFSKAIRDLAVEKYIELSEYFTPVTGSEVNSGETKEGSLPVGGE